MSGVRSLLRNPTVRGTATLNSAPIYVNSGDNTIRCIPAGSGTTEVTLPSTLQATGNKIAAGIATLVSGAVTVATGLTSVLSFQAEVLATGFATGATEVTSVVVTGAPATGAVLCQGYRLATTTASASGTGQFYWIAIGA